MTRAVRFVLTVAISVAALCWTSASATAQGFGFVEITTHSVAEGISMLEGRGGNIGVCAGEDGVFLIDDQFAPLHQKITTAVAAISPKPIRFVLNTHWHGDHTGGNELLGAGGTLIVAHDNVRRRMSVTQINTLFGRETPPAPRGALPVVTFTDAVTFHMNGQEIRAFHVDPAHTDGDAVVHFPDANVVHTGDLYFAGLLPFIDLDSGGSVRGMIAGADRVLALCDANTKIIPGHGPLSNAAELRAYRDMLATARAGVAALVDEGKSLEDVLAAKPAAAYADLSGTFITEERFVTILYHDVKKHG